MTDRELFTAALDHPDPADRRAFLDRACGGDPDRRRRVDVLLRAHEQASQFLAAGPADRPPADPTRAAGDPDAAGPDVLALLGPADGLGQLGKLGHYEVVGVVGKGGMGVVLKALDPRLHRLVAVKLMAPHLAAHAAARRRFDREARAVAAVRDEHVVAIYQVEPDGPTPYLVMEFVGGASLQDRLDRTGPLGVKEVLRIGMQAARGLAAAHAQGIVHRDVKPANILLGNGVERVKITDFGLARAADDASLTQSGAVTGTPNYMSPEQAAGAAVDARSDLFSLGSVLYALCAGHPPFRAETPLAVLRRVCDDPPRPLREVNPDVPDWLDAIVRKLLAKDPAERFRTAAEVADLLGRHLSHLQQPEAVPMPAPVLPPAGFPAAGSARRGCLAPLAFVAGLALLVAFRDTIFEGFFRSGYWAPAYMLSVSGLVLFVLGAGRARSTPGWDRRLGDLTILVVTGGTLAALTVGWDALQHNAKLSRAMDWHAGSLVLAAVFSVLRLFLSLRFASAKPGAVLTPASDAQTAFALGGGYFVLAVGFTASLFVRDVTMPDDSKARAVAFLMGMWGAGGLIAFGPGVFVARRWWRKRLPEERRADARAAVLAGLGIGATIVTLVLTVVRTPSLRAELFGTGDPTPAGADGAYLRVACDDPEISVTVEGTAHTFAFNHPGHRTVVGQRLAAGRTHQLTVARGAEVVHTEFFRLNPGEQREVRIPRLVLPGRTVGLKPKEGSFPPIVERMRLSPDRSAVAVERIGASIAVFDTATGAERFTVERPGHNCAAFGFTPDGRHLAFLIDVETGMGRSWDLSGITP